jgi:hypothetical protein
MATIYNSDLSKEIIDGAKLQTSRDLMPTELGKEVIAVMEVNPRLTKPARICKSAVLTNATSATLYTTPTNQDLYITSCSIGFTKDATATTTELSIKCFIDGANPRILATGLITLTAQTGNLSIPFPHPIKVDRNTAVTIAASTNVGNFNCIALFSGYLDEASNA